MDKGVLYLLPAPLGEGPLTAVIPQGTLDILLSLNIFAVEELRSARRYLSAAGFKGRVDTLELFLLNEHSSSQEVEQILTPLLSGKSVGLISEAGLPAVADPGANLVALAHKNGIRVAPLVGPSSLMLALMASGKNGQNFAFVGYLPIKNIERQAKIRELEKIALQKGQSQIIIETPYRNDALLADFLQTCSKTTQLTIAAELTTSSQYVVTKSIAEWGRERPVLNKKPCVFIL